jgi:hypothetical protein
MLTKCTKDTENIFIHSFIHSFIWEEKYSNFFYFTFQTLDDGSKSEEEKNEVFRVAKEGAADDMKKLLEDIGSEKCLR